MGKQMEHVSESEGVSRKYEKQDQNTWKQSKAAKNLHQTARWWSDIWGLVTDEMTAEETKDKLKERGNTTKIS